MTKRWIVTLIIFVVLLILALLFGGEVIAVLSPSPTATPTASATSTPTQTNSPTPTITPTATLPPTITPTPTETPIPCFTLVEPEDGAEIEGTMGKIAFGWTEQAASTGYRFAVTIPSGYVEEKELVENGFERWLESLPLGGEYVWEVEAVDGDGEVICTAGPFTFSKPAYTAPQPSNQGENGDGNGNGEELCWDGSTPINGACPPLDQ